ncbi:MAG: DMT family transporter [Pseudomonadota bacterium]
MRLSALVALVMVAFAANSILNRMALAGDEAGPAAFAAIRLASGAMALVVLARLRGQPMSLLTPRRALTTAALTLYVLGFSFAYVSLDAGIGALILFGGVQVTMFAGALAMGDRPPWVRWLGMAIGLLGLAWLLAPGAGLNLPLAGTALMAAAAVGWGVYSLVGRGAVAPLGETAGSFLCAAPLALLLWIGSGETQGVTASGWALAITSGVVTSGMGYALWYAVLPKLDASVAGLSQLTVPVIAVAAGVLLLGETLTLQAVLAGALVLGGVAFGIFAANGRSVRAGRR